MINRTLAISASWKIFAIKITTFAVHHDFVGMEDVIEDMLNVAHVLLKSQLPPVFVN